MPRVKRGVQAHAKHKKVLNEAKGYYGARSKVYRVAKRYSLNVTLVAASWMRTPECSWISLQVVGEGLDAADDWIAEQAGADDIVITTDVHLAARALVRRVPADPQRAGLVPPLVPVALAPLRRRGEAAVGGVQLSQHHLDDLREDRAVRRP